VLGLLAAALCAALPSAAGAADVRSGWHEVRADSLYVRSNPNGFTIGTLFTRSAHVENRHTDRFFVIDGHVHGGYVWGYAAGDVDGCGWVATHRTLSPGGGGSAPGCAVPETTATGVGSRQYLLAHHAYTTNDYGPGRVEHALVNHGSGIRTIRATSLFGNYDSRTGRLHDRYTDRALQIGKGQKVSWRYVTKDRKAVMVEFGRTWAFVPRDALPPSLS
jgi:hypothetical protein